MSNLENIPKWDELSKEKQDKLKVLLKKVRIRSALLGLKLGGVFFLSTAFVTIINSLFVQSSTFSIVAGLLNGFMLYGFFKNSLSAEHDRITSEVKEIIK